ncbi:MAG: phosphopentomutase [Peptococcaceae bacterium]|nr:phosphopentomutase [Peptococcaceae bacterium]
MQTNRVIVAVLDSVGIGAMPDAALYGDVGSNTLANLAKAVGGLNLPNLGAMGLGNIHPIEGVPAQTAQGGFGKMSEVSPGKDTTTGHWEMAGIILKHPFVTFPHAFPADFMHQFEAAIGRGTLGNIVASGTEIIQQLGEEHMATGKPIIYTSADSVFQIAAHEDIIPLPELYRICEIARKMLVGPLEVDRVIARPFIGTPGNFTRTPNRHDYAILPPAKILLQYLAEHGIEVMAVGKINDIYHGLGISQYRHVVSNMDTVDKLLEFMDQGERGLIMANLVDFDMVYGHRNNTVGYAQALADFDARLPEILARMGSGDVLMLTADHGCDPTAPGTDHSREYVPLLVYGPGLKQNVDLGIRGSFADLGATIAELYDIKLPVGTSFVSEIL